MNSPSLEDIVRLIPPSVYIALREIGIDTLDAAMKLSPSALQAQSIARSAVLTLFVAFQQEVRSDPLRYGYQIPKGGAESVSILEPQDDPVSAPSTPVDAVNAPATPVDAVCIPDRPIGIAGSNHVDASWRPEQFADILDSIGHVELELIRKLVPRSVSRLFRKLKFAVLSDVISADVEMLVSQHFCDMYVWGEASRFMSEVATRPDRFIREYELRRSVLRPKKPASGPMLEPDPMRIIPSTAVASLPFLLMFKQMETEFATAIISINARVLEHHSDVRSLYGIATPRLTLRQVAAQNGVTGESVRQKREKHLRMLRDLIFARHPALKRVRCAGIITERFGELVSLLSNKPVLSYEHACWHVGVSTQQVSANGLEGHLSLLYDLIGYGSYTSGGAEYLCRIKNLNGAKLTSLLRGVWDEMHAQLRPIDVPEILGAVRERVPELEISEPLIESVLNAVPDYELVDVEGEARYQIRFESLKSFPLRAVVVLREKGKPLHYRELVRQVNHRLAEQGSSERYAEDNGSALLQSNEVLVPLARTGRWALAEWGIQHPTAFELVKRVLSESGKPLSLDALITRIQSLQTDVTEPTVRSAIARWRSEVILLADDTYALTSWKVDVPERQPRTTPTRQKEDAGIMRAIVDVYREHGASVLKRSTLLEGVRQRGFNVPLSVMTIRIRSYPVIRRVPDVQGMYELVADADSLIPRHDDRSAQDPVAVVVSEADSQIPRTDTGSVESHVVDLVSEYDSQIPRPDTRPIQERADDLVSEYDSPLPHTDTPPIQDHVDEVVPTTDPCIPQAENGSIQNRVDAVVLEFIDSNSTTVPIITVVQHVRQVLGLSLPQIYMRLRQSHALRRFKDGGVVYVARNGTVSSEAPMQSEPVGL